MYAAALFIVSTLILQKEQFVEKVVSQDKRYERIC